MSQRTMERGANAVVGYSLTDAQIFGGIGFAALSPSVYHNKQFSSATYMQQIAHKYVDYFFCMGQGQRSGDFDNRLGRRRLGWWSGIRRCRQDCEQHKSSDDETPKAGYLCD